MQITFHRVNVDYTENMARWNFARLEFSVHKLRTKQMDSIAIMAFSVMFYIELRPSPGTSFIAE